jgi:hypothetical protein
LDFADQGEVTVMGKVIPLKEAPEIVGVVKELEQGVVDDSVTEAILIYRTKPTNDNEKGHIHRYWFGENSTITCLGLARHMCDIIAEWIYHENYLVDVEQGEGE